MLRIPFGSDIRRSLERVGHTAVLLVQRDHALVRAGDGHDRETGPGNMVDIGLPL